MRRSYLTNCRLVLPDDMLNDGCLLIEDEFIAAVCPDQVAENVQEIDLAGATLMPGMIDLHSDAIESLAEPRSGIYLPFELAAQQADQIAATNGITTLFNAVSFAGEELGLRKHDAPARLVRAVCDHKPVARTDQRVHCRFEVTVEESLAKILDFLTDGSCDFVSYMNHSPGQGQFRDESNYRSYMSTRYGYSDDTITQLLESKVMGGGDPVVLAGRIQQLAAVAKECSVPFAGHDADSKEAVEEMLTLGAILAEFPMSDAAAQAAVQAGLHQSVGSVNAIRGGSQRTGMSAMHLIEQGQADCLCSDYVPATLLPAVLRIARYLERPLYDVARLVTMNPGKAAGLHDRGAIRDGMKADLVAFEVPNRRDFPVVRATWSHGRIAYSAW